MARLLVAYDIDDAGEKGAGKWGWMARATRVRLPLAEGEGKDITDLWRAGGDLRGWVEMLLATPQKPAAPTVAERIEALADRMLEATTEEEVDRLAREIEAPEAGEGA